MLVLDALAGPLAVISLLTLLAEAPRVAGAARADHHSAQVGAVAVAGAGALQATLVGDAPARLAGVEAGSAQAAGGTGVAFFADAPRDALLGRTDSVGSAGVLGRTLLVGDARPGRVPVEALGTCRARRAAVAFEALAGHHPTLVGARARAAAGVGKTALIGEAELIACVEAGGAVGAQGPRVARLADASPDAAFVAARAHRAAGAVRRAALVASAASRPVFVEALSALSAAPSHVARIAGAGHLTANDGARASAAARGRPALLVEHACAFFAVVAGVAELTALAGIADAAAALRGAGSRNAGALRAAVDPRAWIEPAGDVTHL